MNASLSASSFSNSQLSLTQAQQEAAVAGVRQGPGADPRRKAEEFEAMCLSSMLAPMFDSLPTDGMFGGGEAEGTYRSFYIDAISKEIARSGGVGIADSVQRELLALQHT